MPDIADFNDYILVFPADSGIQPIYVYLKTARDELGTAMGNGEILPDNSRWLETANSGLGAPIPVQVADKLHGQKFSSFNSFRRKLWKTVAATPELAMEFSQTNIDRMNVGKAPQVKRIDRVGRRKSYEIHHINEISSGGEVYSLDNLRVTSPKNHIDLHRQKNASQE